MSNASVKVVTRTLSCRPKLLLSFILEVRSIQFKGYGDLTLHRTHSVIAFKRGFEQGNPHDITTENPTTGGKEHNPRCKQLF